MHIGLHRPTWAYIAGLNRRPTWTHMDLRASAHSVAIKWDGQFALCAEK